MRRSQSAFRTRSLLIGSVTLALLASLLPLASASAAVTLTPATGGTTILADGTYSTLTGPILTESVAGELGTGSIVIGVQQGQADFSFNPGVGTISVGGAGCAGMTLTNVTIAVNGIGVVIATPSTSPCTITWSGIQVKANHAVPLSSQNLTAQGSANIPNAGGNWGNLVEVAAAPQLVFTSGPNGVETVNVNMNDPAILDQDASGNPRSGDAVTLSISSGSGPGTLTCSSPLTQTTGPSGQLTWNGCKIDQSGTYRLHASTGTAQADTGSFVVNGVPTHLAVISYPAATTPTTLTPGLSFGVYDASNNLVTTDTRNVTLSINLNPGSFSCPGGLTKAAVGGVASFPGCTQTVQASGYAVTASAAGVTAITGPLFTVNSVVASKLQLCWGGAAICNTTPPSPNAPATALATQPTVRVQDAGGNTVTSDNTTVVSLAIAAGTPTSGGPGTLSCTGGNSATVVAGIATFTGCAISTAGVGYQLTATSVPALTSSTSSAFTVGGAGAPTMLKFVVQPPATVGVGVAFPSNVQVGITDAVGNVVTSGIAATISLAIGANPGGSTLTCTGGTSAATVNGVATFTGCSLNHAGVGYTLVATTTSTTPTTTLLPVTSTPFNVTAAVSPAQITVTASAPTITWASTVVISVHFAGAGANRSFRLEGARDPNSQANFSLIANLTTNSSGDATFAYTPPTNLYYRAVFAGASDLGAATSPLTRVVVRQISILRPTNNGAVKTISRGKAITFTTTVRPSRPELTPAVVVYTVYQLKNGVWVLALSRNVQATAAGIAQIVITFSSTGSWYVRSQANPTPYNANSVNSPVERYDVN